MDYRRTFPFYRVGGYPNQGWDNLERSAVLEDLDYLRQMYPAYAKKYQVRIGELLNRMDYDGSMLYDQYPDKMQLERFIDSVMTTLQNESTAEGTDAEVPTEAEWRWIRELVTVLVYNEILHRREKKKNYYLF